MDEQLYDRALKGLMEDHAEEMLPELLPESQLISVENVEINRSNIRADLVYQIKYREKVRILNMELQTGNDSDMTFRMLRYYIELYGRYRIPIISMVMYPFQTNIPEPIFDESEAETSLLFHHQVLRSWLMEAEECFHKGVVSMYTLLPAMKNVTVEMLLQAITAMEQKYSQPHLARHLIRLRTILRRSRTLGEQDKLIVEARMKSYDSLLDGDVELQKEIQELVQKRVQEKIAEYEKAMQQGVQQAVLDIVEVRFPLLLEDAKQKVVHLNDRSKLSQLTKQITLAPDETTARWALSTFAA